VEDQLGSHFKQLLEFVKKAEQVQKRGGVQEGQPITGEAAFGSGRLRTGLVLSHPPQAA
jgi:hypothetical protein